MRRKSVFFTVGMCLIYFCVFTGCKRSTLNPDLPVTVRVWHYYNSAQKNAFDSLVEDFNTNVGNKLGIIVEPYSYGDVTQLEKAVIASSQKEPGSSMLPSICTAYADTSYSLQQMGMLVNLDTLLTKKEQQEYIQSYITEGRIGNNNELRIFPTAKATEVFILNRTDWEPFAHTTGHTLEELSTKEGLLEVAEDYYKWSNGKAFYGRDALANYMLVGAKQLGIELFKVENQKLTLNLKKSVIKTLWDNYYVPMVKGYFAEAGRFRSDDTKVGIILGFSGSSTSAAYFPKVVYTKSENHPIEPVVLADPYFEQGERVAVQQGAGMVVLNGTPQENEASIVFLKWFTETKQNLLFTTQSGYLPVKTESSKIEAVSSFIADNKIEMTPVVMDALRVSINTVTENTLYTNKAFETGTQARSIINTSMQTIAKDDRAKVIAAVESGIPESNALSEYLTDEYFNTWYEDFVSSLEKVTGVKSIR